MKYARLSLLSFFCVNFLQALDTPSAQSPSTSQQPITINMPPQPSPIFNVKFDPNIHVHTTSTAQAGATQNTQNTQTYLESMAKMYEGFMDKLKTINKEKYKYAWPSALAFLAGIYLFAYYRVYMLNKLLENKFSWCRWKEIVPLHQLCIGDCDDVIGQLMFDIHKKYYQKRTIDAVQADDQLFIQDILAERQMLESYISIQKCINTLYITRFFPLRYTKEIIEDYIARLDLITDLFLQKCCQQELGYKIYPNRIES